MIKDRNFSPLFVEQTEYKPFRYPKYNKLWEKQNAMHWLSKEVPLKDDIVDWQTKLTDGEKNLLTQVFRFFTQGDVDICNCYLDNYIPNFKCQELRGMLTAFAHQENIHQEAYAYLLDTIGMPEVEYKAFMDYEEMLSKHEYFQDMSIGKIDFNDKENLEQMIYRLLLNMAIFSAFSEGMQLFSSFAMILNFSRFGKMKGMGQIVTWSMKDELLHVYSMIDVFNELKKDAMKHGSIGFMSNLDNHIIEICKHMVEQEERFIKLAFKAGDLQGLTQKQLLDYVKYTADIRLKQLGIKQTIYNITEHPLEWIEGMVHNREHANFFEQTVTEYAKASTQGEWDEAEFS